MSILVEDPLIASMTIARPLPIHESSRRLRDLHPEGPRVYGVAVMADLSRRRWWPLADVLTTDRLPAMFEAALADAGSRSTVARQLAATFAHVVVGRVVPLLALEARAWDTGLENLWVHVDSEGAIDWVGVADPTVRALPDDPALVTPGGRRDRDEGIVALPSEAALTTWVAHRSHRALAPVFARLAEVCARSMSTSAMWHLAGGAVVGAATRIPMLAGCGEAVSMRRGQALLDALAGFGLPVRGPSRPRGKALWN